MEDDLMAEVMKAVKLVVALAMVVEVDPTELAEAFKAPGIQGYYDKLVEEAKA